MTARDEWRDALAGVKHAFHHTWTNCYASALTTGDTTFLYAVEIDGHRALCPISERVVGSYTDIYTPYGFSGFVGTGPFSAFNDVWTRFVIERGYVCGYFALHPLLEGRRYFPESDLVTERTTYTIDLRQSDEQLWSSLHTNRRRQIGQFRKSGPELIVDTDVLQRFLVGSYRQFYRERDASPPYDFAHKELSHLLQSEEVIAIGAAIHGELQALSLFAHTGAVGDFLINVSTHEGQGFSAALLWSGMLRLRSLGVTELNLGGGVAEGDGVAKFKERFGAVARPFDRAKQVYRPDIYERLCGEVGADPHSRRGFFPAYLAHRLTETGR